jgi:ribosome-associated protein
MSDILEINEKIAIPRAELVYRASRAGGAGGQHVNTSSTRIELLWDFESSAALTDDEKQLVRQRLDARIDARGLLRVVAASRRSQLQNRLAAEARLAELLRAAMHTPKTRKKTRPTKASREKRLTSKKKLSEKKGNRRKDGYD